MSNKVKNITKCKICFSSNLEYIENFEHEDIVLNDYDSKTPPVLRVDETMLCKDCDTMHYIEHGKEVFEFTPTRVRESKLNWVSDYEIAIKKKFEQIK